MAVESLSLAEIKMKEIVYICSFIILANLLCAQTTNEKPDKYDWTDTTLIPVILQSQIIDKKIVAIDIGKKAVIYVGENGFRQKVVKNMNGYAKKDMEKIIQLIDSASAKSDTIFINPYLSHLGYLISAELKNGNARVFYKKQKAFVPVITHRLEKYGMYAHRFFYLPDRRPFFSVMEVSGIIEGNKYFSDPKELGQVYDKLADLGKE